MFRFKKIVPCVLLSACVASSVCVMSACNSGKDYSEDIAKLQQQIEDLQTENNSLKDKVNNLTPGGVDYTEEIEALQQQIETLKSQNASYLEESTKLKQQIETLKTNNESNLSEINKLEQQLATLKTSNESNLTEIDKLQQQIDTLKSENTKLTEQANNQQLLIESLQNAVNTEPKIYKVGETFTYSYQGVEFFSITVLSRSEFKVKNINMSGGEPVNSYLRALCYNFDFESLRITNFSDEHIKKNVEHIERTSFSVGYDMVFLGFPSGEDGIIPYAIFDLTTSV